MDYSIQIPKAKRLKSRRRAPRWVANSDWSASQPRRSDPKKEHSRRLQARESTKNGPVNAGVLYPLAPRHNTTPQGYIVTRSVKPQRMPGDKQVVFGREPKNPSFVGGEGGRNWSVRSTTW